MDNKRRPLVSIGLPVHNGEHYLRKTLKSLLSQTYPFIELIISDNASTDGTEAICKAYERLDERIRYFRSDRNRGAAWNFNRVLELAGGTYFKWAAHDDLSAPDFLASCVRILETDRSVVLCY